MLKFVYMAKNEKKKDSNQVAKSVLDTFIANREKPKQKDNSGNKKVDNKKATS